MGMEGVLLRISEFELAAYRKTPSKLYSGLFPAAGAAVGDFSKMVATITEVQNSPILKRIRERALAGHPPSPEDVQAYKREIQERMKGFPEFAKVLETAGPGLSSDGKRLSLHKSWSCLHFLFTGKGLEMDESHPR
jgi:Domain of unknown function (DUF1877)